MGLWLVGLELGLELRLVAGLGLAIDICHNGTLASRLMH